MPPKVQPKSVEPEMASAPEEDKYAVTAWGGPQLEDVTVPSGQLCLCRRPGIEVMIKAGILNDMDSLTSLVMTEHLDDGQTKNTVKPEAMIEIMKNPKKAESMFHMLDKVVCFIVVKPEIHMTPNNRNSMKPNLIYAETVDLEDKMFLMNYAVGGTRDVERFRQESGLVVADMDDVASVPLPSEQPVGPTGSTDSVLP